MPVSSFRDLEPSVQKVEITGLFTLFFSVMTGGSGVVVSGETHSISAKLPVETWATHGGKQKSGCRVIVVAKDHTGNMARSEMEYGRMAA